MTVEIALKLHAIACARCSAVFGITTGKLEALKESHAAFFCPSGHSNYFPGKTNAEKLQEELVKKDEMLAEQIKWKLQARMQRDNLAKEKDELAAEKEKLEKKKRLADRKLKRLTCGLCSCCNKTFPDLKAHMEAKHPKTGKNQVKAW